MKSTVFVVAATLLLPFASTVAEEEEEESWDVSAIPGEPRDITIDTAPDRG